MHWDPFSTLRNALWIGGGQWAGKTTVGGLLAERYGVTHYHYDYHDARGHNDRRLALRIRRGEPAAEPNWESVWIGPTPQQMADEVLVGFADRFAWVLDDLRALVTPLPIVADGWGLRPELVASITDDLRRMIVLVPTDEWRLEQSIRLPRARAISHKVSDPALAQRNRLERDRLIAQDAVRAANDLGIRVIEVDGSATPDSLADEVADHFAPFLPSRLAATGR
jgi:hypothetical protein